MATAPTVYILAGPNGAGKTSLYQYEASEVPRLNGNALYQQGFMVHEVEATLREQLQDWLARSISFVIETNAASERDYALFRSLQKAGYRLELRYVGLESVALCEKRVAQRVLEGGHDVPAALVQQRYANGLSLLKQHYRLFDRLQFYDNTGSEARQIADFLPGGQLLQLAQPPAWAGPVLQHIARIEALYQKARRR